jgi:small subunit ribosomal protein S18
VFARKARRTKTMSEETKPQTSSASDQGLRSGQVRPDKDALLDPASRVRPKRRRKVSYLTINKIDFVDYKEVNILRRFLNDRGKILPARQTGNTAKQQRMIASAIRKAREMALIPFVVSEMSAERREPRRERSVTPRNFDSAPREEAAPTAEAPVAESAE